MYLDYISKISHENKYTKWYISIILTAQKRVDIYKTLKARKKEVLRIFDYVESHHIVPKSINKDFKKDIDNLVYLSAKEHFICHLLLTKMFKDSKLKHKMVYAARVLSNNGKYKGNKYNSLKKDYAKIHSTTTKRLWQDPNYVAKQKAAVENGKYSSPEYTELQSRVQKEVWVNKSDEERQKSLKNLEHSTEECSSKEWTERSFNSPEAVKKQKEAVSTPEHREFCRQRELSKGKEFLSENAKRLQQLSVQKGIEKYGSEEAFWKHHAEKNLGRKKYVNFLTFEIKMLKEPIYDFGWVSWSTLTKEEKIFF